MSDAAVGRRRWQAPAALCALVLLAWLALEPLRAPQIAEAGAERPAAAFSAERALRHVEAIARAPHPTGTAENARVRDYLLDALRALGHVPQVQSGLSLSGGPAIGRVANVLVRIPGSAPGGGARLLAAHYDSVPTAPGAADDAASVAAILETLRALEASAPLQHDLVVLFSDAEEVGLLGARRFLAERGEAGDLHSVLNFEYRGSGGAMALFQAPPGSGALVGIWAAAVSDPVGNSASAEIFRLMPNDTDLSVFARAGVPGLNFAALDRYGSYHTRLDDSAGLDRRTLQQQGETLLALVRALDEAPAPLPREDRVYFTAPLIGAVTYPRAWVLPFAGAAAGLVVLALVTGCVRRRLRASRVAASVLLGVAFVALCAGLAEAACRIAAAVVPDVATAGVPGQARIFAALSLLLLALAVPVARGVGRFATAAELSLGVLLPGAALLLALALFAPGAAPLLTAPVLLGALVNLLLALRRAPAGGGEVAAHALALIPVAVLLVPLAYSVHVALTLPWLAATAAVLGVPLALAWPLLAAVPRAFAGLSALAGAGCAAAAVAVSGFHAGYPQTSDLAFIQYDDAGRSLWLSDAVRLDPWSARVLAGAAYRPLPEAQGKGSGKVWSVAAPSLHLPQPAVDVLQDTTTDARRDVVLRVASRRAAPKLRVVVEDVAVLDAKIDGRPFSAQRRERWAVEAHGIGAQGLQIALQLPAGRPFTVRAVDVSYGIPDTGIAMPAAVMPAPTPNSHTTRVVRQVRLP